MDDSHTKRTTFSRRFRKCKLFVILTTRSKVIVISIFGFPTLNYSRYLNYFFGVSFKKKIKMGIYWLKYLGEILVNPKSADVGGNLGDGGIFHGLGPNPGGIHQRRKLLNGSSE